jgi:hypothetical protein
VRAQGVHTSSPQAKNIGGDLLILDAGSMVFRGNHPVAPGYTTADACARACAAVPGCNAYNFCGRSGQGCGSGCGAYVQKTPKLPSDMSYSGGVAPANKKTPVAVGRRALGRAAPPGCSAPTFDHRACSGALRRQPISRGASQ